VKYKKENGGWRIYIFDDTYTYNRRAMRLPPWLLNQERHCNLLVKMEDV